MTGKAKVVSSPGKYASAAPLGVTERGTVRRPCPGASLVRLKAPTMGEPAVADEGTSALTVNAADPPAEIARAAGCTAKPAPVAAAATVTAPALGFWKRERVRLRSGGPRGMGRRRSRSE